MRRYFIILLLLLIFSGCGNSEDKKNLDAVEKELQVLLASEQSQNTNWEGLKSSYENVQARLTQLSSSSDSSIGEKANSQLMLVQEKLKRVYEELDYAKLMEAEQQLASVASYEDAIQKAQELLSLFNNFAQKYPSSPKPIAEGKTRIKSLLESAYNEKYEYNQLSNYFKDMYTFEEASAGVVAINAFLQKHPNSMMGASLRQKADGMREVQARLWAQQEFKSISSLNAAIQAVNKLITESTTSASQDLMQSLVTSLQAKKSEVFREELADKTNDLMNAMRTAAINSAKKVHPICGASNDPASVISERRNIIGARIEIFRSYVIRTSGGLFCSSTYLVGVNVDGYLTGNENVGVSHRITSSRIIVDRQF
ncbi:MAG TPA: hypothetical protein VGX92_07885 [Pyrinomonadaceae bacterium]|jgi:hypothetical protein|nr:hypothetical protein [Pyrinomonadaceae bacterium]